MRSKPCFLLPLIGQAPFVERAQFRISPAGVLSLNHPKHQNDLLDEAILQPPSPPSWQCSSVPTSAEDVSGLASLIHDAHYQSVGVGGLTLDDFVAQSLSLEPATTSFDFHQFNQDADNHSHLQQDSSITTAVDTAILDPSFWDPTLILDPSIASEISLFPTIQQHSSSVSPVDSFLTLDTPSLASSVSSLSPKEFASSEFGDAPATNKSHHARENKPAGGTDNKKKVTKDKMAPAMSVFSVKTSVAGRKRTRDAQATPEENEDEILADKRRRNNAAAAKYRQKKVDRISELEDCVAEISKERDDLKLQLAKRDEEIRILREMLMGKK
ncbi:hypothetical protein MCOR04_009719 [Pyricularia oryzae]|nr:hypothetical protein MCOR04_009719 [Pyricularia oryzae]